MESSLYYSFDSGFGEYKTPIFGVRTPELSAMVAPSIRKGILQVLINGVFGYRWINISKNDLRQN